MILQPKISTFFTWMPSSRCRQNSKHIINSFHGLNTMDMDGMFICIIKFVWSSNLWTLQFHSNGPCYYFFMENFNIISEVIVLLSSDPFYFSNSCFRMKFYFFNVAILYIERGERKSLKKFKERLNARMTIFDYQKGQVLCQ